MKIYNIASRNLAGLDISALENTRTYGDNLVVDAGEDALKVAKAVDSLDPSLIIVQDNQNIIGIINPDELIETISSMRNKNYKLLEDALKELSQDPDEISRNFEHESFNHIRVRMQYCGEGDHYVERLPCPRHK